MINKRIRNKRKTEVHALGHISMSAHKARRVIDQIRGRSYEETLTMLAVMPYQVSYPILKIVRNAGANASYTRGYNKTNLIISKAEVNEGTAVKKWKPRARGRSYPIKRPTCHIKIGVKDISLDNSIKFIETFTWLKKPKWKNKDTNMIYHNIYSSGGGVWDKK